MEPLNRMTPATVDVLAVLLADEGPVWGLRVIKESGRPPGSVYPILERLEHAGWVTSAWEDDPARSGPRRRFYVLTAEGAVAARDMIGAFELRRAARSRPRPRPLAGGSIA